MRGRQVIGSIRRACGLLLAAFCLAGGAASGAAADPIDDVIDGAMNAPEGAQAGELDHQPQHHEIAAYTLAMQAREAPSRDEAEALLRRALAMVPEPGQVRGVLACVLAAFLYDEARDTRDYNREVMGAVEECMRLLPGNPRAQLMGGVAHTEAGQVRKGTLLFMAAIKADPRMLDDIEIATMQGLVRKLGYAGEERLADDLRALLVTSGFGKDDPRFFGDMALDMIAGMVERHSNSEALALLPQIMAPDYGLRLLVDRRFAPIWPMVEQWAGGDLKRQREASLAAARAQFQIDASLPNRRILADALWGSGKHGEALTLLKQAVDDPALWDESRFYLGMMTARYVKMLVFEGRIDEATAVAAKVSAANPPDVYPHAMNLMPNFALALIQAGRSQQALDLIDREMPTGKLEDPASYGFYAALRYCAYRRLGQARQAADQSQLLDTRFAANGPARNIRSGCAADASTVRSLWVARMTDPALRSDALLAYSRARLGIRTLDMLDDMGGPQMLQDNAPLEAAFQSFGRDLPETYLPALRMWDERAPAKP